MSDLVGQVIANYRLDDWIGDGGMGSVFKAYDLNLERVTALKLMHRHYAQLPEFRARLAQEARISARLDHTSIVRIYGFGDFEERLYIAMEFIGGGNLRSHLTRLQKSNRYLPLEQSLQITAQIADALDYAHENGAVHRDVKPSNILLKRLKKPDRENEQPFRAVLTDFGLVKVMEGQELTESGMTVGTPTYMSPEQCQGSDIDGRSDLYSLGVILYELVSNKLPFVFKNLSEALAAHLRGTAPVPPSKIRTDLPMVLDSLILKALSSDADERFDSGSEMSANLRSAILALGGLATQIDAHADPVTSEEHQAASEIDEYWLRIETPGQEPRSVKLTRQLIKIGRNADNDIVLPSEGVSRYHASIQYHSDQWLVVDNGGVNGTWLNKRRLFSEENAVIEVGSRFEIGPYVLYLEGPTPELEPNIGIPISELPTEGQLAVGASIIHAVTETSAPIELFLANDSLTLEAGQQSVVNVEVINNSNQDDSVALKVRGLPASWLRINSDFTEVPSQQSKVIPLVLHPPKDARPLDGKQRFRVELQSQRHPDLNLSVRASLQILADDAFELRMRPRRLKLPGRLQVSIKNVGNIQNELRLEGRDIEGVIKFRGEQNHITLNPGQTAKVEMQLESRRPKLLGNSYAYGFEIEVSSESGSGQILNGTAKRPALLPSFVVYIVIFFFVFLCVLAALFGIVRGGFLSNLTPTTIPGVILGATATAQKGTSLAAEAAATSQAANQLAATVTLIGDQDGDGLSDTQERVIGTDPAKADSDNDTLLDGEEVLTWATNPLSQDTDSDELLDGAEVHQFGTSPTNYDTDGDGLSDGQEIVSGSNPLDAMDPIPAVPEIPATPALPPPSPTPVSTVIPRSPTPTSTISPSPFPVDTPTPEIEPTDVPDFLISCTDSPPVIDGTIDAADWHNGPLFSFTPEGDPQRTIQAFVVRDAANLYLGYIINDPVENPAVDSINVALDSNFNGEAPDNSDRLLQILRNGVGRMLYGLGNESTSTIWESNYESSNWQFAVGESGGGRWDVEIAILISEEIPDFIEGGAFGHMILASYSDILGVWPSGADLNDSSTWQAVATSVCP